MPKKESPVVVITPKTPVVTLKCVYVPRNVFTDTKLYESKTPFDANTLIEKVTSSLPEQYRSGFCARAWLPKKGSVTRKHEKAKDGDPIFYNFEKWNPENPAQLLVLRTGNMLVLRKGNNSIACPMFDVMMTYHEEYLGLSVLQSFEHEFLYGAEQWSETPLIERIIEGKKSSLLEGAIWLASKRNGSIDIAVYDQAQLAQGVFQYGLTAMKMLNC